MHIDRALLTASWKSWVSNDNRHRVGPWWLAWLWTLLFCAGLAVPFTLLGFLVFARGEGAWRNLEIWAHWYGKNFIVSLTIGVVIHLLFDLGRAAKPVPLRAWKPWLRTLYFSGTPILGIALGWPLGVTLSGANLEQWFSNRVNNGVIFGILIFSVMITFVIHHFFAAKSRQIEAEKRATEAQLRLLQAQIEPHFLFNTLANVLALIDHDSARARQMLQAFTEYLRSSLAGLRTDEGLLSQELELAENYLRLLAARMEDRLRFCIEADAAARAQRLPPLLLQPLVENAVLHGLEPTIAGGQVSIRARVDAGRLVLEVQDDGRGIDAPPRPATRPGAGMALANIRQRLLAHYGSDASLDVSAAHPGTLARITLPLHQATP